MQIESAHRTFAWNNDASGMAAVHCVIIGFSIRPRMPRRLFDYQDVQGSPAELTVDRINPYLVDAPDVVVASRTSPICHVPEIVFGSMANDGGHLLLSEEERNGLLAIEPAAGPWVRRFLGAEEFLHNTPRWCLWLKDCAPNELSRLPAVRKRVAEVKSHRLASRRPATNALAATPQLFGEIRQPDRRYLLIPRHSSERRDAIPMDFLDPEVIVGDANLCLPEGELFHFGVLNSRTHMAWVKHVCGRIKSDFRYTNKIVYNNFPWPDCATGPGDKHRSAIEHAAQTVLDARAMFPNANLAELYDPETMPAPLSAAHAKLDAAVDAAYGYRGKKTDLARAAMLFARYENLTRNLSADIGEDEGSEDLAA